MFSLVAICLFVMIKRRVYAQSFGDISNFVNDSLNGGKK